jgi:DNA-directed RNA polymerase specialized sigma24 family protein
MSQSPGNPSDWQLLSDFYNGNPKALDILAGRYDRKLAGFLQYLVNDPDVAEDLLNNVWTAVYLTKVRGRRRYNPSRGSVEGYLMALAGHLAWLWLTG